MRTSTIRFTGLASGLDTESMVKAMLTPYQNKVDSSIQNQTLLKWKKDAYKEMNTNIYSFFTKNAHQARLSSTFNKKIIISSDSSKVEVKSGGVTPEGTHTINKVTKLAEAARMQTSVIPLTQTSSIKRADGADVTLDTTLEQLGLEEDLKIRVSDGTKMNVVTLTKSDKISDVLTSIKGTGAEELNLNISFDEVGSKFNISPNVEPIQKISIEAMDEKQSEILDKIGLKTTNVNELTKLGDLGIITDSTIEVNDGSGKTTIKLTKDMTIGQLNAELSKAMPNASVGFDQAAGSFFISSKKTGANQSISIEAKTGDDMPNLLSKLGLAESNKQSVFVQGSDSLFTYNGVVMQTHSNVAQVNGMELTLKAKTDVAIDINVTPDTEATVSFIKEFVESYNTLVLDINKQLRASSIRGYKPLTAEQKKEMPEDDIKLWEGKIKKGLLRNDATLKNVSDTMREALSGVVEGNEFKALAKIGITTGDWREHGKIYLDEDELRKAISKNSDAVTALFVGGGDPKVAYLEANEGKTIDDYDNLSDDEKKVWEEKCVGLGDRLYNGLKESFKAITNIKSATSIFNDVLADKKIDEYDDTIDELEDKLNRMEDIYYKRFTAMEKMMSQLNNQSNWLAQQLGGM